MTSILNGGLLPFEIARLRDNGWSHFRLGHEFSYAVEVRVLDLCRGTTIVRIRGISCDDCMQAVMDYNEGSLLREGVNSPRLAAWINLLDEGGNTGWC